MAYRFLHAADIHLDSPLRSLALRDPALADLIGNATRQVLVRIVDLCLDERVDALMLSGDLYDGDQTSMLTARFLAEQVKRLHEAGIGTFVIRGNHDAMSKITRELTFPDSVHVFGDRAKAKPLGPAGGAFDVVVHGVSFKDRHAPESLLPRYERPVPDAVNIGLMHTSLGETEGHSLYAPCALADLHGSGFQYWALGHIHVRRPPTGGGRAAMVVMPGIPQGRDIGEAGAKSVTLVTVGDDRSITVEERVTSVAQFERVPVDLGGVEDWRDALATIEIRLGQARAAAVSDHLVARLVVTGATPLAPRLRRDADLLGEDAAMRAEALGRVSIDRIELGTSEPEASGPAGPGDLFSELRRLIAGDVLASPEFGDALADIADDLRRKLPPECRDAVLGPPEAEATTLARLAADGVDEVLERLRGVAASRT